MAAGDFKWDSAKDGCCRMGLQSASLEHINCEHIIRQRCSFMCEAHSVKLGFAPVSPHLACYHFAPLCLTEMHVLVWGKNSSFYKTPEPWGKKQTNPHEVENSRSGHSQAHGTCCNSTCRTVLCLVPSQGDNFVEEIQILQARAFLCYRGCKQGILKPRSHPWKTG